MKKRESSLQILAVIIAIAILGILFISAVNAYWVKEMKVEMEIDDTSQIIGYKETLEGLEITIPKNQEVKIKIKFETIIDCESFVDIILIDGKRNIHIFDEPFWPDREISGGGCEVSGKFFLPEIKSYTAIIVSPGEDESYGKYTREEFLKDCQAIQRKTKQAQDIVKIIASNTVGIGGSSDLMATKEIKVKTEDPQMNIRIEWTDDSKTGIRVYGIINLPENTAIKWRFSGSSIEVEGDTEIDWNWGRNKNIEFKINDITPEKIREGNCKISIFEKGKDEDGNLIIEENILPEIQKTIPTTKKFNGHPVSRSASSEISESTPRPSPPPTTIEGIPETSETPGIELPFIFLAIAVAVLFKKRKK
jgi:hypothetical protein